MGEIADQMISGEVCAQCGVYFEPGEVVWQQANNQKIGAKNSGYPVICKECKQENKRK